MDIGNGASVQGDLVQYRNYLDIIRCLYDGCTMLDCSNEPAAKQVAWLVICCVAACDTAGPCMLQMFSYIADTIRCHASVPFVAAHREH